MKILAFDISGTYSSIALLNGSEVNAFTQTHERKHRPEWGELFSRINFNSLKDFDALDALAFAQGPGSYTALRITASFLKPIAVIKNLPLIPISNLKSLAYEASQWIDADNASIVATIEADKNESYCGSFLKSSTNQLMMSSSISSPPSWVSPFVESTSNTPSPISKIEISNVPPPKSYTAIF